MNVGLGYRISTKFIDSVATSEAQLDGQLDAHLGLCLPSWSCLTGVRLMQSLLRLKGVERLRQGIYLLRKSLAVSSFSDGIARR